MAFKRKYKFSIIDHLYYAGRIRRIHNRWSMPLDAIFLWVFAVVPSLLIIRFLYWVIPLWLPSALSVGLVWAAVEVPITAFILKERIKTISGFSYYCRLVCF